MTLYTFDPDLWGVNFETPKTTISCSYTYNYPDIYIHDAPNSLNLPENLENENGRFDMIMCETFGSIAWYEFDDYFGIWMKNSSASSAEAKTFINNLLSPPVFFIKSKEREKK